MSGNNQLDQIMHIVKSDLRSDMKDRMLKYFPDAQSRVTKRLINETYIYLKGYSEALKEHVNLPINKDEMQRFLFDRAFEYIKAEIKE